VRKGAARIELHHAIGVSAAAGQHLVLVAHDVDLHARQRPALSSAVATRAACALRALGDQADVGSEQIARVADVASVTVVRRLAGIVALVPADVAVILLGVIPVEGSSLLASSWLAGSGSSTAVVSGFIRTVVERVSRRQ
jgi:hypothetical protein